MVAIAPFRALRYDVGKVNPATVSSPPHDCITTAQRDAFLASDPHNIVRVVLGPEQAGDHEPPEGPNKFTRAAAAIQAWEAEGTLKRDNKAAFYLYTIEYGPPEHRATMTALVARLLLDPTYKEIRRHEKTLHRKKRERLSLREATECDTEPIWLLYRDRRGWVEEILRSNALEEVLRFTDEEDHEHRVWRVDRAPAVAEIIAQFDDRTLVIADGHHRYQTALDHFAATRKPGHGSIMVCLVRDDDAGTRIESTHRLLQGLPMSMDQALEKAKKHWNVTPIRLSSDSSSARAEIGAATGQAGSTNLVVVASMGGKLQAHHLSLKPESALNENRGRLDSLAVSLLHERLLRDCWGLDLDKPEDHLRFTRSTKDALDDLIQGTCQIVVMPPPEPVTAVLEVAEQGHVMPQKATYFVPKLRSGIFLGPLDEAPPTPWTDTAGDGGKAQWSMPKL